MLLYQSLLIGMGALQATFLDRAPLDGCSAPELVGSCTANAEIDVVFLLDTSDPSDNIDTVKG